MDVANQQKVLFCGHLKFKTVFTAAIKSVQFEDHLSKWGS